MIPVPSIQVSPEWQALKLDDLSGVLLVVGAPDSGKSTFARYLFNSLRDLGRRVAFIDGDPGQSIRTANHMTLTFEPDALDQFSNGSPQVWRYFIGSTTPQDHVARWLARRLTRPLIKMGRR
jgi:polynucleotide 5'-hydroxyl-kinase GRC3/NOL9